MVQIFIAAVSILGIISGRLLLRKWFNHLTIYSVIWGILIFLYEMKLLPYVDIVPIAWFYIILSFLSFLCGILTIISAKNLQLGDQALLKKSDTKFALFIDGGKTVKYALFFFSLIAIYAGIQNWMVLIDMFGSIPAVFLNATTIYRKITQGGLKGVVPFISNFGYVAVFFSGIYTAYKGRFSLLTFLPFIGIIIKELANVGRFGILLGLMEFLFTFFLFRHLLNDDSSQRFRFSKKNAVISSALMILLFIGSTSFIRLTRGSYENYTGASRELNQLKDNIIITPSIYLYLSSTVGVLSKYTQSEGEKTKFGQNTFLTVYHILDRLGAWKRESDYQKGYFIPMWTNTGTYVRELHADFGIIGILFGPFLLGLITTWLWFKFYESKSLLILTLLVYMYLIVGFSFLVMVTRTSYWSVSQILIVLSILGLERIAGIVHQKSIERTSGRS